MILTVAQTNFSRGWLSKPKSPLVRQRMLDIEVVFVVEDSNLFVAAWTWLLVFVVTVRPFWRDGNCGQINLIVSVDRCLRWYRVCHDCV
jgi:hypothetical protein